MIKRVSWDLAVPQVAPRTLSGLVTYKPKGGIGNPAERAVRELVGAGILSTDPVGNYRLWFPLMPEWGFFPRVSGKEVYATCEDDAGILTRLVRGSEFKLIYDLNFPETADKVSSRNWLEWWVKEKRYSQSAQAQQIREKLLARCFIEAPGKPGFQVRYRHREISRFSNGMVKDVVYVRDPIGFGQFEYSAFSSSAIAESFIASFPEKVRRRMDIELV